MRASWVEMISTRKGTEFQAAPSGVAGRRATTSRRFHKSRAGLDSTSIRSPAPSFARELRIVHQRDLASDVIRLPQADPRAMGDVLFGHRVGLEAVARALPARVGCHELLEGLKHLRFRIHAPRFGCER